MTYTIDKNENRIVLTVQTGHYSNSVALSVKAFLLAEKMNHHPTVTTGYNTVVVEISTHDAGNKVTVKDEEYMQIPVNQIN